MSIVANFLAFCNIRLAAQIGFLCRSHVYPWQKLWTSEDYFCCFGLSGDRGLGSSRSVSPVPFFLFASSRVGSSLGWGLGPPLRHEPRGTVPKRAPLREVSVTHHLREQLGGNSPLREVGIAYLPKRLGFLSERLFGDNPLIIVSKLYTHNFSEKTSAGDTISSRDFWWHGSTSPGRVGARAGTVGYRTSSCSRWQQCKIQSLNLPNPSAPSLPRGARDKERADLPRGKARESSLPPGNERVPTSSPRRKERNQRQRK